MTVAAIAAQVQTGGAVRVLGPGAETPRPAGGTSGPAFAETMSQAIDRVDAAQKESGAQVEAFVAGETENVHEVMIAMNQAELHFQLMTEVRNKLLDGYQELMRMQV